MEIDSEIEKYALRDIKLWIEKNFFRNLNDSLKIILRKKLKLLKKI